jgi:hypothetical protein
MQYSKSSFKTIIQTGLLAGTLDGLAAALLYSIPTGKDPLNVYRFVASGVFGKEAFTGGVAMGLVGILFHYGIAMGWTVLFFLVYPRVAILSKNKIVTGIFYGVFVWVMMNMVVLPLSNVPMSGEREVTDIIKGMVVLMICIGLPISWMISKHYSELK